MYTGRKEQIRTRPKPGPPPCGDIMLVMVYEWKKNIIKMYRCNGACGKPDCAFAATTPANLKIHADPEARANWNKRQRERQRERVQCPRCEKTMNRSSLPHHMVRKHKKRRRKRRVTNVFTFAFLRKLVRISIQNDKKAGRRGDVDDVHIMAEKIFKRASGRTVDDNGGNITGPCALVFQPYSLFSLTLDRIDDTLPHFVNNSLDNVIITVRGMNTWCSLTKGKDCCALLRAEMERTVTEAEVEEALAREKTSKSSALAKTYGQKARHNILYTSVHGAFRHDPKARAAFGTVNAMFAYCYNLYAQARARCAISSIFMSGHAYSQEKNDKGRSTPHPFQPSLDAIHPNLGHVRGNLRIVCRFLNCVDQSKGDVHRTKRTNKDAPQQWTPTLWKHYIQPTVVNTPNTVSPI